MIAKSNIRSHCWDTICSSFLYLLVSIVFFCISTNSVNGRSIEVIVDQHTLRSPADTPFDHFGASLDVSGDILAVGVPYYDSRWSDSGAVYLYEQVGDRWRFTKKLQAQMPRQQGLFGSSVALDGSYLVVGEPGSQHDQKGYVHVFARNYGGTDSWGWLRKISRPDDCHLRVADKFGDAVSLSGDQLLIGAPTACKNRQDWIMTTGAAYLYSNYGRVFRKKLIAHNGVEDDHFGAAVAQCGSFAFVGAPEVSRGYLRSSAGSVYIYRKENNWGLHRYLSPSNTLEGDRYGTSVACAGNYAAIGAPAESRGYGEDSRKGAVFLYKRNQGGANNWGLMQHLDEASYFNEEPERNNHFGQSVALGGNYLIVGYGESQKNNLDDEPRAIIFKLANTRWLPEESIIKPIDPSCSTSSYDTGFSVATDGISFAVGDMEDESDSARCDYGFAGGIGMYERIIREVEAMVFIHLLLAGENE